MCVLQARYSVPVRYAGRPVTVRLGAHRLEVLAGGAVVATHARSLRKGVEVLALDHYLEILARKPGALAGASALAQARESGVFTATHKAFWDAARRALGDAEGTRALIEVLLLHWRMPAEALTAGMRATLQAWQVTPELVAIEARRILDQRRAPMVEPSERPVGYRRAMPTLAG